MTLSQGNTFTDPGATTVDNADGTVPVLVSGSVNTAVPGNYTLSYSAQDAAGNKASKTRTVNVVAAAPKVTIKLTAIGQLLQMVEVVVTINNGGSTTMSNVKSTSASLIDVKALLVVPNGFSLGACQPSKPPRYGPRPVEYSHAQPGIRFGIEQESRSG
jgi:hypothetical protein